MTTNLKTVGEERALVIGRRTLAALGIDETTRLEVSVEGGDLGIRPGFDDHRARVLHSALKMFNVNDETFRKLARRASSSSRLTTSASSTTSC